MTQDALQAHIHMVIHASKTPLSFGAVQSGVALRCGERIDLRAVDRALQALRKRKIIEYVKSQGEKGTHGWKTVDTSGGESKP